MNNEIRSTAPSIGLTLRREVKEPFHITRVLSVTALVVDSTWCYVGINILEVAWLFFLLSNTHT